MNRIFILLICNGLVTLLTAQNFTPRGICGVTHESQQLAESLFDRQGREIIAGERNQVVYVPVKFHLTATNEGTGRVELFHVLNQLCILNSDFATSNMVFYMSGDFAYHNVTNIYENPGTSNSLLVSRKDPKALNVFITENADPGNTGLGTVLGYYSPQGDYVVVRKLELVSKTNTLSHEIGHFFNLRHTFYGWEGAPYDKNIHGETVTFTTVPGGIPNVQVELMNKSNCNAAADMICDTPPDYNFGASANGCNFNLTVFDKNNEKVVPMINNQMSYFSNCNKFEFTDGQTTRMRTNYNTFNRLFLRSSYIPSQDTITEQVIIRSPSAGAILPVYDGILLDWDEVQGATKYMVEIRGSGQYYGYITSDTQLYITELRRNQIYTWSIRPFNEVYTCAPARNSTFRTGNGTVSTADPEFVKSMTIYPNPSSGNEMINLELVSDLSGSVIVEISSITGNAVYSIKTDIHQGHNHIRIPIQYLKRGMYITRLITQEGRANRTFVII